MYIIAIGWLYVTVLMALTETSVVAGVLTLFFYGLFPVALLLWLLGTPMRRQRQREQVAQDEATQDEAAQRPQESRAMSLSSETDSDSFIDATGKK